MAYRIALSGFILAIATLLWGFYLQDLERLALENHCLLTAFGSVHQDEAQITALERETVQGWRRMITRYRMVLRRGDGYTLLDYPRIGASDPGVAKGYEYYHLETLYQLLAKHGLGAEIPVSWTPNPLGPETILLSVAGEQGFATCHTWDVVFLLAPTLGLCAFSLVFGVVIVVLWRRR